MSTPACSPPGRGRPGAGPPASGGAGRKHSEIGRDALPWVPVRGVSGGWTQVGMQGMALVGWEGADHRADGSGRRGGRRGRHPVLESPLRPAAAEWGSAVGRPAVDGEAPAGGQGEGARILRRPREPGLELGRDEALGRHRGSAVQHRVRSRAVDFGRAERPAGRRVELPFTVGVKVRAARDLTHDHIAQACAPSSRGTGCLGRRGRRAGGRRQECGWTRPWGVKDQGAESGGCPATPVGRGRRAVAGSAQSRLTSVGLPINIKLFVMPIIFPVG
jgi:hypothetical protein